MKNTTSEIRSFNRFYTSHLDILNQSYLNSNYTLTEVRIIHEISEAEQITAQEICEILNLDKGYVSRILKHFLKDDIIEKISSQQDKRAFNIKLTVSGNALLKNLSNIVNKQTESKIEKLTNLEKERLVNSMQVVKKLLAGDNKLAAKDITYRHDIKPGDLGYIIYLHSLIYAQESNFSSEFESYVIKSFSAFLEHYSPEKDHIWMAEYNNKIIGCIAIVHKTEEEAQLRWFLLDPDFRGLGIGNKLLNDAIAFCHDKKYKNVFLLTTNMQLRALEMYKKIGFELTESKKVNQWGTILHDERYDLKIV